MLFFGSLFVFLGAGPIVGALSDPLISDHDRAYAKGIKARPDNRPHGVVETFGYLLGLLLFIGLPVGFFVFMHSLGSR